MKKKNKVWVFEAYRKINPQAPFELKERKLFTDGKALVNCVSHRVADPIKKYGKDKAKPRFYTKERLNRTDITIEPLEETWAFTYNFYYVDSHGKPMNTDKLELLEIYKKRDNSEDFDFDSVMVFNDKNDVKNYLENLVNGWTEKFGKHEVLAKFYEDDEHRIDVEVKPEKDEWAFVFNSMEIANAA